MLTTLQEYYINKKYDLAVDYMTQNKQEFSREIYHYNMGTILAKKNDFALARYHLEKARNLGFKGSLAKNNLEYVVEKLSLSPPSLSFRDQFVDVATSTPVSQYLSVSLVLLLVVLILHIRKMLSWKKTAIFVLLSYTPLLLKFGFFSSSYRAISLDEINVYEGPSKIFVQTKTIPPGEKFILGQQKNSWYYVRSPSIFSGWIKKDNLGVY